MARPRKATALKIVTGTWRADRENLAEPTPPVGTPERPPHLSARAADAWDRVVPLLTGMGVLSVCDGLALASLVECYADVLDARDALLLRGARTYESRSPTGGILHRSFPEVAMLADADRRLRGWLAEFGLSPATRARVGGNGVPERSNADAYFN